MNMFEVSTEEITVNWGNREIIIRNGGWTVRVVPMESLIHNTQITIGQLREIQNNDTKDTNLSNK